MLGSTRRAATITAAVAALIGGGVAVAVAANPSPDGTITVCVKGRGEYYPKSQTCARGWRAIAWNAKGVSGPPGLPGPEGSPGVPGNPGAPGDDGDDGGGTIFAASGGAPLTLTTLVTGDAGTVALLPLNGAKGSDGVSLIGGNLDVTQNGSQVQIFPRDAILTSFAALARLTAAGNHIGVTVSLRAQLYTGDGSDNVLTPVPGATCVLAPPLIGAVPIGSSSSCVQDGLSIPITAGTAAAIVYTATSDGPGPIQLVSANLAASMSAS